MSADKCPVCGFVLWATTSTGEGIYECGKGPSIVCPNAEELAIERAAEVERLRAGLERIATQGPFLGPDGTPATWKHWAHIASETLNQAKEPK